MTVSQLEALVVKLEKRIAELERLIEKLIGD
jgi:uncharacterized coiled-coil protein SlyX